MKLLTIYQIIKLLTGIFINKAFHMKLPYNLQKHFLFERTDHEFPTTAKWFFQTNVCMYYKKSNTVSVTGIKLWNSIDNCINISKTEQVSKTEFKCFFICSYLEIVEMQISENTRDNYM